ncbi:MAG: hypothetical protein ACLPKW_36210, partial [Acetobacteraceae bacterium]
MLNSPYCGPSAGPDRSIVPAVPRCRSWLTGVIITLLAGCAPTVQAPPPVAATAPPTPPPVQPVPLPQAVANAASAVFSSAPVSPNQRQVVVIDPLVNGVTGEQSVATQQIQDQIIALARSKYPQFDIEPFSAAVVSKGPDVMVGTFTPVNAKGQTAGTREGYRFCLVMVDLSAGKTVAKGVARARLDGVDATPIGFFRDSPAWTNDASVKSYIDTCQATKVGDPISKTYLNGILTASLVSEAINAYDASRYGDALDLYVTAEKTPAGNQLRVFNGLYLTNWRLGHRDQAEDAFGHVVDYGLDNNALGVKILFRPGTTSFDTGQESTGPYDMWLRQIATHSASRGACIQVTGNSSPTGSAALNDQLGYVNVADVVSAVMMALRTPGLSGPVVIGSGSSVSVLDI